MELETQVFAFKIGSARRVFTVSDFQVYGGKALKLSMFITLALFQ